MSGAADILGVHANTVRAWTDQGLLTCLRINRRGDRRYRQADIDRFLAQAKVVHKRPARRDGSDETSTHSKSGNDAVRARSTAVLEAVARLAAASEHVDDLVVDVCRTLCGIGDYTAATLIGTDDAATMVVGRLRSDSRVVAQVRSTRMPFVSRARREDGTYRAGLPVPTESGAPRVLLVAGTAETRTRDEEALLSAVAAQLATAAGMRDRMLEAAVGWRRAELLMSINSDLGSQLDLPSMLNYLLERVTQLFDADHGGVFTRLPNGQFRTEATVNLSAEFREWIEHASTLPVVSAAMERRHAQWISNVADDPRVPELRRAFAREGINTIAVAPLMSDGEMLGALSISHKRPFEWRAPDIELFEQLAHQASMILRNAQNYIQMATWAAQLQSIQQLGARLTRLRTVEDIGHAICAELNTLIDFHNVRVYRVHGEECVPVAWRGQIGEYEGEDMEQLRLQVGQGVTGWVARHGLAQNVGDAANDRRAETIPGTEDDLDESLLLAPMLFEDDVLGVIVLAKLGLNQFSADDLRLLEIYASIAAQAMANADATEQLHAKSEALSRQLNSQRELLRVTESILSTLDTQAVLQEIAERLRTLVHVDNIYVDVHDARSQSLRPIFASGVHAEEYLTATAPDNRGVSGEVIRTGEAQMVQDELADGRVYFGTLTPQAGAIIVAPLRSSDRIQGVLTIERLGAEARFADEEFELVKLFAAHVSIALQNAEAHRAVELRAETDMLTGVWNHGALMERIDSLVASESAFSMLMVDLDFFKKYNDRYGHQQGNVMLRKVSEGLRSSCRETDMVFRYGGDEFALLLPETNLAGAIVVAGKIQEAVESMTHGHVDPVGLTCSIGIAVYPQDGADGASIILAADRACYAGKRGGRARIATAADGLALAGEFQPTEPTPLDLMVRTETYPAA